jgi:hypothetical protein
LRENLRGPAGVALSARSTGIGGLANGLSGDRRTRASSAEPLGWPGVSLYDWLLFLHVLAAFLLVAGVVAYGVIVLGGGDTAAAARRVLAGPAPAMWNLGGIGVLVIGIALAIEVDAYQPWDGWILAAIALWFVAFGAGGSLSRDVRDEAAGRDPARARVLWAVMAVATAVLLVDMVFKPGA